MTEVRATGRLLPSLRRPEHGKFTVYPEHLDEDVTPALVLGDDGRAGVSNPGDAILAADRGRVELGGVALLIQEKGGSISR